MASFLSELDRDWARVAAAPASRRRFTRWVTDHPALDGLDSLSGLLEARRDPARAPGLLAVLAGLAPGDDLAARALLQALVPGIVCLAGRVGRDDPRAIEEMVSLAWERIRTYPPTRTGSVAGNVLLDVLKRYRRHRLIEQPSATCASAPADVEGGESAEDAALRRLLIEEILGAHRAGIVSAPSLGLVVRSRLLGVPLAELCAELGVAHRNGCQRRWRAETRLRERLAA